MTELKRKIEAYKQNGDRTIIEEILKAVDGNFMHGFGRERIKDGSVSGRIEISLPSDQQYIAYRIRAMRELLMKHINQEGGKRYTPYINEFQRYLSIIYIDFKIEFKGEIYDQDYYMYYFTLNTDLFDELDNHLPRIKENFSTEEYSHFMRMFKMFRDKENELKEVKIKRISEIMNTAERALEYALKYVKTDRSNREIVKYINKVFISKFSDEEIKRNGLTRLQRKGLYGKRDSFLVRKHFGINPYKTIFGKDISDRIFMLTEEQKKFVENVVAIVEVDKKKKDVTHYTCDSTGEVRVSKKYIAKILGISHESARKKISRILKRIR
ncbi:hypothetical protein LG311_10200 [Sutcliffiella horikoshii]|uniref:hypothetical protein n=1 Tax=Sutcliffiella horikoshii TaxID=79883 RepID=UPI00384EE007